MSQPLDFLLKCYNALSPEIAATPSQLLAHLNDYRLAPLVADDTTDSTASGQFSSSYDNYESSQSAYAKTAMSFGLTASFGPYSGSFQANSESERESNASVVNGTLSAVVDRGTLKFKHSTEPAAIAKHLDPQLLQQLNAIDSLAAAEAFTRTYGTHLVLGVKLGGTLQVSVAVTAQSLAAKDSLSAEVKAKYAGAGGSIAAVAKASREVKTTSSVKSLQREQQAMGGDPGLAAGIDLEDAASIQKWVDSCTVLTVSGVSESVELYTLAAPTARQILQRYLRLCVLKHSVENPVIFLRAGALTPFQFNTVAATVEAGYKIIGGGAALETSGSDYLTSSYPLSTDGVGITSWQAVSHDLETPSPAGAQLVSYAIGVYDPADLLVVECGWADGGDPVIGPDEASQRLDPPFTLTGGGCETGSDQAGRYVTASYPAKLGSDSYNAWVARSHDRDRASAAYLKAWVIGIRLQDAVSQVGAIKTEVVVQTGSVQSHGNTIALLGGGARIAGGGVALSANDQNLLQASFPVTQNGRMGWQAFNSDLGGVVDPVVSTAYALTLHFQSLDPAISFQPYGSQRQKAPATTASPR